MEKPESPSATPAVAPANPATSPVRAFAQSGVGKALFGLALLAIIIAKQLMPTHRPTAALLLAGATAYVLYFLWARRAKVETRVLTGMDAVRDRERRHRHGG